MTQLVNLRAAKSLRHLSLQSLLAILCFVWPIQFSLAQPHRPPPKPAVRPLISDRYANDTDGDRIDDQLAVRASQATAAEKAAATSEEKAQAQPPTAIWQCSIGRNAKK